MSQEHPLKANRSFLFLLIPIAFAAIVVLSGNWLYQIDKNEALSLRKKMMEQKLNMQQAAPLKGSSSCKAN
jgi:uncharacterized membrane protein YsdA (DUF1294 family)